MEKGNVDMSFRREATDMLDEKLTRLEEQFKREREEIERNNY